MSHTPKFELDPALAEPDLVTHQTHQLAQALGNFAFYDRDFARGLVNKTQTSVSVTDEIEPDFELPGNMSRRRRAAVYGPDSIITEHRFSARRLGEHDYAFELTARTVQKPVTLPPTIALAQQPMYDGLPLHKIIKNAGLLRLTHQLRYNYYTPNPDVLNACESFDYKGTHGRAVSWSCTCGGGRINLAEEQQLEAIETAAMNDGIIIMDAPRLFPDDICFDPTEFDTVQLSDDDPDALLREWASVDFDAGDQDFLTDERYQIVALAYGTFRQMVKRLRSRAGAR